MTRSQDRATPPRRPAARKRSLWMWIWRFFRFIVVTSLTVTLMSTATLFGLVWITRQNLPSYEELVTRPRGQAVTVRAADGSILAHLGPNYGEWFPYADIPKVMRDAMVAVEDRRFYYHIGVDPIGFGRAMWINMQARRWVQGGSTITQQVAKNLFLTSERSFNRKGREMLLALALDWTFSKEQLLELYLNRVYFGGGAYGVDAASRRFFGHSAHDLSLPEAVVIAGLVKAPSRYAPSSDPKMSRDRARVVLKTMVEAGFIKPEEAETVRLDAIRFVQQPRENNVRYFTDWVLAQVDDLTTENVQPIDVITTLNVTMQHAAEEAVQRRVPEGLQGSLIALGYDGAVKAMVGGKDYVTSTYNRAVYARRQPGSAFKLFVYLTALEQGKTPSDVEVDEPITIDGWSPVNSNRQNIGPVTLTQAFAQSINTVAVKLANEFGFDTVASMARRLGIQPPILHNPSMALGTSETTLINMTSAYATVARGGLSAAAYGIRQIVRADGVILYSYNASLPDQVLNADTAAEMTKMMVATIESGTGRAAKLDRPAAGKTGTTSDNRDGWFLGFTGDLTAGVWLGRDDNKSVPGLAGGKLPARVWADFMRSVTAGLPPQPLLSLSTPDGNTSEPDDETYGITPPTEGALTPPADRDNNPAPPTQEPESPQRLDEEWLDTTINPADRAI